ncbi:MAG: 50S ribosomal protein L35 [Panacagrimonas sp.]
MPKLKTIKSAAKRFKKTAKGGYKRGHAFKRHILTKMGGKTIRQLRGVTQVNDSDVKEVNKMLPYA